MAGKGDSGWMRWPSTEKGAEKGGTKGGKSAKGTGKSSEKGGKSAAPDYGRWEGGPKGSAADKGKGGKGKVGKDVGSFPKGGKGVKGKGGDREAQDAKDAGPALTGAKTVQELEAEIFIAKLAGKSPPAPAVETPQKREASKLSVEAKGQHCEVRKHSDMGCAVVTMESEAAAQAVVASVPPKMVTTEDGKTKERAEVQIGDHTVQMRKHFDKEKNQEVKTDIFVAWGHKSEKQSPLAASAIAEAFDKLYADAVPAWRNTAMAAAGVPAAGALAGALGNPLMQPSPWGLPGQLMQPALGGAPQGPPVQQATQGVPPEYWQMMQLQQQQAAAAAMAAQALAAQQAQQVAAVAALAQQQRNGAQAYNMYNYGEYSEMPYPTTPMAPAPERKPLTIVNPTNGQPIEVEPLKSSQPDLGFRTPGRKKLAIIDPNSGNAMDAVGLNFSPPRQARPFSIIDPTSGSAIKV